MLLRWATCERMYTSMYIISIVCVLPVRVCVCVPAHAYWCLRVNIHARAHIHIYTHAHGLRMGRKRNMRHCYKVWGRVCWVSVHIHWGSTFDTQTRSLSVHHTRAHTHSFSVHHIHGRTHSLCLYLIHGCTHSLSLYIIHGRTHTLSLYIKLGRTHTHSMILCTSYTGAHTQRCTHRRTHTWEAQTQRLPLTHTPLTDWGWGRLHCAAASCSAVQCAAVWCSHLLLTGRGGGKHLLSHGQRLAR